MKAAVAPANALAKAERTAQARAVREANLLPNEPFRESFLKQRLRLGLTQTEVAERLNENPKSSGRWDVRRVGQTLGLTLSKHGHEGPDGRRAPHVQTHVSYGVAVVLCEALGMDPREAGL